MYIFVLVDLSCLSQIKTFFSNNTMFNVYAYITEEFYVPIKQWGSLVKKMVPRTFFWSINYVCIS